jgi:hypothetical protein
MVFCFSLGGADLKATEYSSCADVTVIQSFAGGSRTLETIENNYRNFIAVPPGTPSTRDTTTGAYLARTDKEFFVPLRKNSGGENEFLTCGFSSNSIIRCENDRLSSSTACTRTVKVNNVDKTIDDCDKFDSQSSVEDRTSSEVTKKIACYPENHICNKYGTKIFNNYFKIDEYRFGIINSTNSNNESISSANIAFYLYKKNVIDDGLDKNCELIKFPCDYRVKNESLTADGVVNVVFSNNTSDENVDFYNNIFSGMGNKAFFKYVGRCKKSEADCLTILKSHAYYKYINKNRSTIVDSDEIYYFVKNIDKDNIGVLCNKYLPNCREDPRVVNGDFSRVLYNDMSVENYNPENPSDNFSARIGFYASSLGVSGSAVAVSSEANLWYVNNGNFVNMGCLAVRGVNGEDKDIGYCSDLNDEMTDLKYKNGLNKTKGKITGGIRGEPPNCYLKSCIDLTPSELKIIKENSEYNNNKYCSEYFWLSNSRGFKYFPREKPVYCSNLASGNNSTNKKLAFGKDTYINEDCPKNASGKPDINEVDGKCRQTATSITYSRGGGLNKDRDNCYLKNCYSLNDDEKNAVSWANMKNVAEELRRAYAPGVEGGTETPVDSTNLPRYCDDGFLFNSSFTGFEKFNYLDLNIIPCFFFSANQIVNMGSRNPINFTDFILNGHDYENSTAFCRAHYIPLNTIEKSTAEEHEQDGSFLEFMLTIADEKSKYTSNSNYKSYIDNKISGYNNKTISNFSSLYVFLKNPSSSTYKSTGKKVPFSNEKLSKFSGSTIVNNEPTAIDENRDKNSYVNICKHVDNNFLYYNANINSSNYNKVNNHGDFSSVVENIRRKNPNVDNFDTCIQEESGKMNYFKEYDTSDANMPEDCKSCSTDPDINSCLYKKTTDCKMYLPHEYKCKKENCSGENLKYCEIKNEAMALLGNCEKYKSVARVASEESYFDCGLYFSAENAKQKIFENFKTMVNFGDHDNIANIKLGCQNLLPLDDDNEEIENDYISSIIKPYESTRETTTSVANSKVSKDDLERYGCSKFKRPNDVRSVYGCKLPSADSSYISKVDSRPPLLTTTATESDVIINGAKFNVFSSNILGEYATMSVKVCARYPSDVFSGDDSYKCGEREGSKFEDKCKEVSENRKFILDDKSDSRWIFEESTGGTRFRGIKNPRGDLLILRDFYSYHHCYADHDNNLVDEINYLIVLGESAIISFAASLITCPVFCAILTIGCPIWLSSCIPTTTALGAFIASLLRIREWQISLQNDMAIARGYNDVDGYRGDKGFISPAFLTDNDNYMYRFYPRAENIEDDIKNKLESNIDESENRFFHGGTRGGDIIKKCKFGELLSESGDCIGKNNCSYSYEYKKYKADGTIEGKCKVKNAKDIPGCLNEEQKKCIESYGVNFVPFTNFNDSSSSSDDFNVDFVTESGNFLSKYKEGDIQKDKWGTSSNKNRDWVPVDIVYDTKYNGTESSLASNDNCKLNRYGDPENDLSRCRGFKYTVKLSGETNSEATEEFFTESQMVRAPLMTSPFLFYTLITPKNTPELFNPSFIAVKYYSYKNNESEVSIRNSNEIVLDFFNPKMKFDYDYPNGVSNPDYENISKSQNNFVSQVSEDKNYSSAYVLLYKSNMIEKERHYNYVLHKTYTSDLHGEYIPRLCVYMIAVIEDASELDTVLDLPPCSNSLGCLDKESNESFIVTDNDIACYPRAPLALNNLIIKPDPEITYLKPIINVYLRPNDSNGSPVSYDDVSGETNREYFILKQGDRESIENFGFNKTQGYGLNFSRSHCSRAYYDYYNSIHQLEKQKSGNNDMGEIKRLQTTIHNIESAIIPDCNAEDGNKSEFIINIEELKPIKEVHDISKVITKKTAIVREFNESYGGHNEICVSDSDLQKIMSLRSDLGMVDSKMPKVLAFKNSPGRNGRTKCVLNLLSRNETCLVANEVYVYCDSYSQSQNGVCIDSVNITDLGVKKIKKINCRDYIGVAINSENIEAVKACFRGGFNYSGNIHNASGEKEITCLCEVLESGHMYDNKLFVERDMTPREYGLCVDLIKPNVCPAVKYYNSSKKYVDNTLAINKTQKELMDAPTSHYEQHLWRTSEKILGKLPSVFFSETLRNAEFENSVYCGADDDSHSDDYFEENCIGGKRYIEGECNGFWKNNSSGKKPLALCIVAAIGNSSDASEMTYEYKLLEPNKYGCERYECPAIGYDGDNNPLIDEKAIINSSGNMFDEQEIERYVNVKDTDYRSYSHNEEKDLNTVDMRGASSGFALWKRTIAGDFAWLVTSEKCLTGFGPAGSESQIREYSMHSADKLGRCRYDRMLSKTREVVNSMDGEIVSFELNCYSSSENEEREAIFDKVIENYKKQKITADNVIASIGEQGFDVMPSRKCNQLGKWQKVNDYYNYEDGKDDRKGKAESFYYNDVDSFWYKILVHPGLGLMSEEDREKYGSGYCERLVCGKINSENYCNIYANEVLDCEKEDTECKTWKHIGGADWESTTAPRNSTNKIVRGLSDLSSQSRNITYIFDDIGDENNIANIFKYVKKVRGECRNLHGYYERGTNFISDYNKQFDEIVTSGEIVPVDPRTIAMTKSKTLNTLKPMRICSSNGLWSGIIDRCFRACEMMDMFYTKFDSALYNGGVNLQMSNSYFVENYQIQEGTYPNGIAYLPEDENEMKFTMFGLRNSDKPVGDFMAGDYLNGGAKWPRSIVNIDSPFETTGPKAGLRYIEVVSDCDSRYSRSDNQPSQYVLQNSSRPPKRRCYEDGTWGQVKVDTRCLLAKNCKEFDFTVKDLAKIIEMHINGKSLNEINDFMAGIAYGKLYQYNSITCSFNDENSISDKGNCKIGTLNASNTTIEDIISMNSGSSKGSFSQNDFKLGEGYITPNKDKYPAICCLTESCIGKNEMNLDNNYVSGWNIKERDIYEYFVPKICKISRSENVGFSAEDFNLEAIGSEENLKIDLRYLNRLTFLSDSNSSHDPHYIMDSLLHFVYDKLYSSQDDIKFEYTNWKNESGKSIIMGNKTYKSYQVHAKCDTDLFFNETDTGRSNYYDKHIVFECKNVNGQPKFSYYNKTKTNSSGENIMFIRANDCKPRSCGGSYNNYQKLFSTSYVKEVMSGSNRDYYNIGNGDTIKIDDVSKEISYTDSNNNSFTDIMAGSISYLTCKNIKYRKSDGIMEKFDLKENPEESYFSSNNNSSSNNNFVDTTFIVAGGQPLSGGNGTTNEDYNVYKYFESNGTNYQHYGFVETFQTTCSKNRSNINSINGITVTNKYDLQRFADLEISKLPKRFCKELNGTDCDSADITEAEMVNDDNFKQKYCVPVACPGKNLRLDEYGGLLTKQYGGSRIFHLKNYFYSAGDVVVIESLKGDYKSNKKNANNITPNFLYYQYDDIADSSYDISSENQTKGSSDIAMPVEEKIEYGHVCETGYDVYNSGTPASYSLNDYLETLSDTLEVPDSNDNTGGESEKSKTLNCFRNLETINKIENKTNGSCESDYVATSNDSNSVCVKYGKGYGEDKNIGEDIKNAIGKYNPDSPTIDTIKKEASDYIYRLITSGNNSSTYANDSIIKEYIKTNIVDRAKTYAKEEAKATLMRDDNAFVFYNPTYSMGYDGSKLVQEPQEEEKYADINSNIYRYIEDNNLYVKIGECDSVTDDKNVTYYCEKMQKLTVFNNSYASNYATKENDLKEEFKNKIKNKTIEIAKLNSLFDKYYKIFRMKNFLSIEENIDKYNKYLSTIAFKYMDESSSGYYASQSENSNRGGTISFNSLKTTDAADEYSARYYIYNIDTENLSDDNFICKTETLSTNTSDDESSISTTLSCPETIFSPDSEDKAKMVEAYEIFFVNFLDSGDNFVSSYKDVNFSAKAIIQKYIDDKTNLQKYCITKYENYMATKSQKDSANEANDSSKFKSGLFMVMKCERDGWKIIDSPSCKKRCTGEKTFNLNPEGVGNFDVTEKVTNLRHNKKTGAIEVGAHRGGAACSCNIGKLKIYRRNGADFSCDDGELTATKVDDKYGLTGQDKYHSHGAVWKIYCSGFFSAFGITTGSTTYIGGEKDAAGNNVGGNLTSHAADTQTGMSLPTKPGSFTWRDFRAHDIAFLCPGDENIKTFYKMSMGNTKEHSCTNKLDGVTSIQYKIKRNDWDDD